MKLLQFFSVFLIISIRPRILKMNYETFYKWNEIVGTKRSFLVFFLKIFEIEAFEKSLFTFYFAQTLIDMMTALERKKIIVLCNNLNIFKIEVFENATF